MRIKTEESLLIVIDFQEKLMPVIHDNNKVAANAAKLVQGCQVLGVPVIVTHQYTKGLGDTVSEIKEHIQDFSYIEKTTFSCWPEPNFAEAVKNTGCKNIIICGVEAHICVQQTVLDLLEEGYNVYIVMDCISSRFESDKKYAGKRMVQAGATVATVESVLFELCVDSKNPNFKAISKIIK